MMLASSARRDLLHLHLLQGHPHRHHQPPSSAGIPLERGPLLGLPALPLITGPGVLMRSPGIHSIGNLAIHAEAAASQSAKTALTMIVTRVSSAAISFLDAAHAGEEGGDMDL